MSVKKKVLIGLPLLLVLLLALGYVSITLIDHFAKSAVEKGCTQAMGVPTSVASISLKPFRGEGRIQGLEVSNPTGFKTPCFMRLSEGNMALEVSSVLEDQVVMNSVELSGIELYLEKTREGANYTTIFESMKKGEQESQPKEGKKFLVQSIVLKGIQVHVSSPGVGQRVNTLDVNIDEIRLENVGSDTESGLVMSQLMGTIVKATLAGVLDQGVKLPVVIAEELGVGLADLGMSGIKVTVKVAGKVIEGAEKLIGGAVKGVSDTVRDVFGGDDKK